MDLLCIITRFVHHLMLVLVTIIVVSDVMDRIILLSHLHLLLFALFYCCILIHVLIFLAFWFINTTVMLFAFFFVFFLILLVHTEALFFLTLSLYQISSTNLVVFLHWDLNYRELAQIHPLAEIVTDQFHYRLEVRVLVFVWHIESKKEVTNYWSHLTFLKIEKFILSLMVVSETSIIYLLSTIMKAISK